MTASFLRQLEVFAQVPRQLYRSGTSPWASRVWGRPDLGCFLEAPLLRPQGSLWMVDVAWGRILSVSARGEVGELLQYAGNPNGLAQTSGDEVWVADATRGLMKVTVDGTDVRMDAVVSSANGIPFLGLNDLVTDGDGGFYITDQGDSGLQDASGRVLHVSSDLQTNFIMDGIPSPNGIATNASGDELLVAVTRDNSIWRGRLNDRGELSRVGRYIQLTGGIGPDGIALGPQECLLVARLGLGEVSVFDRLGRHIGSFRAPKGLLVTNVCVDVTSARFYATESETNSVLVGDLHGVL